MDILNTLNVSTTNENQLMSDLNRIIKIKHHKEKNKNKTTVYGIFDFVPEKDIEALVKLIKKKLGCSGIIAEETTVPVKGKKTPSEVFKVLIFSGNHVDEIKAILLEKNITDRDHIKV